MVNSGLAIFYSLILFAILFTLTFYIIRQVINTQKVEKTIIESQKLMKQDKLSYRNLYKLGQLYLKKKLFNKAILIFRQALKSWDINDKIGIGSLSNTIGFTYFKLKKYKFAIYYYKVALRIVPDYLLALKNLAYLYEINNLFPEAYDCYCQMLKYDRQNSFTLAKIEKLERQLILLSN